MERFDWCYFRIILFILGFGYSLGSDTGGLNNRKLFALTVATEETDGFLRYMRSAKHYGLDVEVLGKGHEWTGGDVKRYPGGGQKIRLLREKLQRVQAIDPDLLIIFTDSYDVIINGPAAEIIDRYDRMGANIVFSAEEYCWPDKSLKVKYPVVKSGKRYLNSGMFMGRAKDLLKLVSAEDQILDSDDDQLFYTNIYLDENKRKELKIKLDHTSTLFQNLNGVTDSVELHFEHVDKGGRVGVRNLAYSTEPLVIHGNGNSKVFLNYLGNYIGGAWKTGLGCVQCATKETYFTILEDIDLPTISLALFVERPTPFLDGFFQAVSNLRYPKSKIHLFLHNNESYHRDVVQKFLDGHSSEYASVLLFEKETEADERSARNAAIDHAIDLLSEYLFVVDSDVRIVDRGILTKLMDRKVPIVAPAVRKLGKLFSNFWGGINDEGFYERSDDYIDIVEGERKGMFNVPHVSSVYLIEASRLKLMKNAYSFDMRYDPDMSFTRFCLDQGYFMYVDNQENYGYLINADDYDIRLKHPDFYQLFDNRLDWESRYLHENYTKVLQSEYKFDEPCPDVYWFPIFSAKFCQHLIDIMENFGQWSSGSNKDERLSGGYENVPTRDIHTNQVGLERHWLYMLDQYVRPVQETLYVGYYHVPPHAIMNFVVRYRPDEQPSLRPHHDASTYTINLALNEPGVDYQGGGARFLRYNCSVVKNHAGWALMHPGRLTHYHEGLPTTQGTRYILVSFVDP